jgi:glycine C-acetyltransferase
MASGFSEPLRQVDRTHVVWRGRKLIYFGGCDYLRLSFHPEILRAAQVGLDRYGLNVAASRRTTGNHLLYEQLEVATRRFFAAESAIFVANGYLTNISVAQGLRGMIDHAFVDERAHSSLRDAVVFLGCPETLFSHRNAEDLRRKVRKCSGKRVAILTDGMFAHDGSIAPLAAYRAAAGPKALLWVDDAHAAGILGKFGRGSVECAGLGRRNVVQTITFSKAFGAYGGAILCDRARARKIISNSAALAGNTPLSLPLTAAALAALRICREEPSHREKLWRNVALFWKELGLAPKSARSPIISVGARHPAALKRRLLENRIYPVFIEYGAGPKYFRFALSSEHTAAQIKRLARVLAASRRKKEELLFLGLDV